MSVGMPSGTVLAPRRGVTRSEASAVEAIDLANCARPRTIPVVHVVIGLALAAWMGACSEPPPETPRVPKRMTNPPIRDGEMVRADGTGLVLGDLPFRFVGANAAMIHGESAREGMPALLDAMRDDGISVVRVWAAGEAEDDGKEWRRAYAFRLGPDLWVESSFAYLDALLVEARKRNIRVMITLLNRWGDYGGLPQYARWVGLEPRRRNLLPSELGHVLANEEARALYRDHVQHVVGRTNSISGVAYRDDPTIFSWELANELSAQTCATDDALFAWIRDMARFVRSLDANHLVGAGHIGYKTERSRRSWRRVTRLGEIGYADVHSYPHNVLAITDAEALGSWIDDRAHLAENELDKPLILGEIGFRRGDRLFTPRATWFGRALDRADADALSGLMIWIYRSWDERDDPQGVWAEGPHAEETTPVRNTLRWTAVEWAGTAPELDNAVVASADDDARLFPLGLEHLRPWTEGEWETLDPHRGRVTVDPWALAEGCAAGDGPAEVSYVIDVHREDPPSRVEVALRTRSADARETDHGVEVWIDGVMVGTWHGRRRFESAGAEAIAEAFATPRTFRYLELRASSPAGRRYLERFTAELPGEGAHRLTLTWPDTD